MRKINKIIIHCADTRVDQDFTAADIDKWHKQRGWNGIGYHYVILLDGTIQKGRPEERAGAHCKGHNLNSIGVCFMGGKNEDGSKWEKPLEAQIKSYLELEAELSNKYQGIEIKGHYDLSSKSCPNFEICKLYD